MPKSFGQTVPPLTEHLKNLLDLYPAGPQIFRELLQNADDAKAKKFCVGFDARQFPSKDGLLSGQKDMSVYQGPAFFAINSSLFQKEDFTSLSSIGRSGKAHDTEKTGRYGLGFCSTYHLTDFPCMVSGNSVLFLDPHKRAVQDDEYPGILCDAQEMKDAPSQCEPFDALGCNLSGGNDFDGTLFRFPMRLHANSEISTEVFSSAKCELYLNDFVSEAAKNVLFLRHVQELTVIYIDEQGDRKELLHISVSFPSEEDQTERKRVLSILKDPKSFLDKLSVEMLYHYHLKITIDKMKEQEWLISCCLGAGEARKFALKSLEKGGKMIPFGCIATRIDSPLSSQDGQAFCSLPLPIMTGMPLHLNAFFEISSNRRQICTDSSDLEGEAKIRAIYNQHIMTCVLSPAMIQLLKVLKDAWSPKNHVEYLNLFPTNAAMDSLWNPFIHEFYKQAFSKVLLPTIDGLKDFETPSNLIFVEEDDWKIPHIQKLLELLFSQAELKFVSNAVTASIVEGFESVDRLNFFSSKLLCKTLKNHKLLEFSKDENLLHVALHICTRDTFTELRGCYLIPLLDGSIDRLNLNSKVYILSEEQNVLLGNEIPKDCKVTNIPFDHPAYDIFQKLATKNLGLIHTSDDDFVDIILGMENPDLVLKLCRSPYFPRLSKSSCKKISTFKFVTSEKETLEAPDALYEPLPHLKSLLPLNLFPRSDFDDIVQMKRLLFASHLKPQHVRLAIQKIVKNKDYPLAKLLLKHLIDNHSIIEKDLNWSRQLLKYQKEKWFPAFKKKLKSDDAQEGLCAPETVLNVPVESLFSYVDFVRTETIPSGLDSLLGLRVSINQIDIIQYIRCLSKQQFEENIENLYIERIVAFLYELLENGLKSGKISNKELKYQFSEFQSIFSKSGFVNVDQACIELPGRVTIDFLFEAPILKQFPVLAEQVLIIKEENIGEILIKILEKKIAKSDIPFKKKLEMARPILELLVQLLNENKLNIPTESLGGIYLPTTCKQFKPIDDLYYSSGETKSSLYEKSIIHLDIPISTSKALGAKSFLEYIEKISGVDFEMGEDFEQNEDLTTRIKGILNEYDYDEALLTEFVQNAEDAKASSIEFTLDKRVFPSNTLCSDHLKCQQGPALIIKNDRQFSQEDFESLKNIGKGAKLQKLDKIGRFSLGINTAYGYSNCIHILSGKNLIILDPQRRVLRNKARGRMFDLQKENFCELFSDQVKPFVSYGFKEDQVSDFTVFRLPLRMSLEGDSHCSFSSTVWSIKDIEKQLQLFSNLIEETMLFLHHIKKVSINIIEHNGDLKQILSITKDSDDSKLQKRLNDCFSKLSPSVNSYSKLMSKRYIHLDPFSFRHKVSFTTITPSKTTTSRWKTFSVISNNQELLSIATNDKSSSNGRLVPFGSVSIKLNDSNQIENSEGRIYCTIPLPSFTGLSFHINGFFEPDSNRRDIRGIQKKNTKAEWNRLLMTHCLAPAVIDMIKVLVKENLTICHASTIQENHMKLLELLCLNASKHHGNEIIRDAVMKMIPNEPLFYCKAIPSKLHNLCDLFVLRRSIAQIEDSLISDEFPFTEIPEMLREYIQMAGIPVRYVSQQSVLEFYSHKFKKKEKTFAETDSENMLKLWRYCLFKGSEALMSHFPVVYLDGSIAHRINRKTVYSHNCIDNDTLIKLIPGIGMHIVHPEIVKIVKDIKNLGFESLTMENLAWFLKKYFPECFKPWDPSKADLATKFCSELWDILISINLSQDLSPLNKAYLIPTLKHGIWKVEDSEKILNVNNFYFLDESIFKIVESINIPLSNCIAVTQEFDQNNVLNMMNLHQCHENIRKLNPEEKTKLRKYLEIEWRRKNYSDFEIFETYDGKFVSLNGNKHYLHVYFPPPLIPNGIMLMKEEFTDRVRSIDITTLYKKFIIPLDFRNLCMQDQLKHLDFCRLLRLDSSLFSDVEFVHWKKASELWDPRVDLFKELIPDLLPPLEYRNENMLQHLLLLGMRKKVNDKKDYLMLARSLEGKFRESIRLRNTEKFTKLIQICSKLILGYHHSFASDKLYDLEIFPTTSEFKITNLKNGTVSEFKELCYTTKDTIHPDLQQSAKILDTLSGKDYLTPSYDNVLKHLVYTAQKGHCNNISNSIRKMYEFLSKKLSDKTSQLDVTNAKVIYLEGGFVEPSKAFWEIQEHCPPFFYSLSGNSVHKTLFDHWGASPLPTVKTCKQVLHSLGGKYRRDNVDFSDVLIPGDQKVAIKCIELLLTKHELSSDSLILLSAEGRLVPQRFIHVDDSPVIKEAIEPYSIHFLHPSLSFVPYFLQLKRLSTSIEEEVILLNESTEYSDHTKALQQNIQHKEFQKGVLRLYEHVANSNNSKRLTLKEETKQAEKLNERLILLSQMSVKKCSSLKTVIRDFTKRDITRKNSSQQSISGCTIDPSSKVIYLHGQYVSKFEDGIIVSIVANEILRFLDMPLFEHTAKLVAMLQMSDCEKIPELLDSFCISNSANLRNEWRVRELGHPLLDCDKSMVSKKAATSGEALKNIPRIGELVVFMEDLQSPPSTGPSITTTSTASVAVSACKPVYAMIVRLHPDSADIDLGKSPKVTNAKFSSLFRFVHKMSEKEKITESSDVSTDVIKKLKLILTDCITQNLFVNPVVMSDGFTYERDAIAEWLKGNDSSPLTREKLSGEAFQNIIVKQIVQVFEGLDSFQEEK